MVSLARSRALTFTFAALISFPLSAVKSLAFFKPRALSKQQAEMCPNADFFSAVTLQPNEKESKTPILDSAGRISFWWYNFLLTLYSYATVKRSSTSSSVHVNVVVFAANFEKQNGVMARWRGFFHSFPDSFNEARAPGNEIAIT